VFVSSAVTSATKIEELCLSNETIESCVVRVLRGEEEVIIFAIYRPHSDYIENFNIKLV
jgi:hypothetical protein